MEKYLLCGGVMRCLKEKKEEEGEGGWDGEEGE